MSWAGVGAGRGVTWVRARAGSVEPEKFGEVVGTGFPVAVEDADALAAGALGAGAAELAADADALVLALLAGEPELAGAADAAPAG